MPDLRHPGQGRGVRDPRILLRLEGAALPPEIMQHHPNRIILQIEEFFIQFQGQDIYWSGVRRNGAEVFDWKPIRLKSCYNAFDTTQNQRSSSP